MQAGEGFLSKAQRLFAHKLLLPKARHSGFSSQIKQRGLKQNSGIQNMRGKTGKRLVTNGCFLLCKKLGAICSVGGVFSNFKGEGPQWCKENAF